MSMSTIHNAAHKQIGLGINLNILLRHAKKARGVKTIRVTKMQTIGEFLNSGAAGAAVRIIYANDDYGDIEFASYDVACKWAIRKRLRQGTYFTGCVVGGTP